MNRPTRTPRWPEFVFAFVVVGIIVSDLLTWWQHAAGHAHVYNYWLETSVGTLAYAVVGLLIATKVPGNRLGPIMLGIGVASVIQDLSGVLALSEVERVGPTATITILGSIFASAQFFTVGAAVLVLLLAPTGRPMSRRWGWVVRLLIAVVMFWTLSNFLLGPGEGSLPGYPYGQQLAPPWSTTALSFLLQASGTAFVGLLLLAVVGLGLRWSRARGEERSRVTWVAIGGIAGPAIIIADGLLFQWHQGALHGSVIWALAGASLPTGIAVAVFRHGLYELDRVVSRTVSYTLVTGVILSIYIVIIAGVSALPVSNSFAVAVATLTAASAFRPLLNRIRIAVDRRFDRTRYDGEAQIAEYARGLERQIDLETVAQSLQTTVRRTVSPTTVTLWLRDAR